MTNDYVGRVNIATGETAVTEMGGSFSITTRPTQSCLVRVRCPAVPGIGGAQSGIVAVATSSLLSRPNVPFTIRANRPFWATGTITPSQRNGRRVAEIRCYRLEHGSWVFRTSVWASGTRGTGYSNYAASVTLTRGSWRLIARQNCGSFATTYSAARTITVR